MEIDYWRTRNQRSPVMEFIQACSPTLQARILKDIEFFQSNGMMTLTVKSRLKKLSGGIYELRSERGGDAVRILLTVRSGKAWLLSAHFKKDQRVRAQHIKLAIQRSKDIP